MYTTDDEEPAPRYGPPPAVMWFVVLAVVTLVQWFGTWAATMWQTHGMPRPLAMVLIMVGPVLLLLFGPVPLTRRRLPVLVFAVTAVAMVLYYGLGFPYGPGVISFFLTVVVAVVSGHRLVTWVGAWCAEAAYFGLSLGLRPQQPPTLGYVGAHVAWLLVVLGLAELIRQRRERILENVRTRREEHRLRATEERLTIAQELHDVLAHNISMINVQAGVGLHLMDEQPEQARTALSAIKQASAEALGELRSVLDVLRAGEAPRNPTPSLTGLDLLADRTRAAGLRVDVDYTGERRTLPAPVELAAFRIVQEALTNVVKHAAASTVRIALDYGEHVLSLLVEDDGRGHTAPRLPGTGSGIEGMRRRATALGGTLEADALDGAGFRVAATVPTEPKA
ncbi:MAG: sensor histidine kinase [Streptosporangiales bacterium]|nr:sensor histidine kinase [Streptosporangiales bacterium]